MYHSTGFNTTISFDLLGVTKNTQTFICLIKQKKKSAETRLHCLIFKGINSLEVKNCVLLTVALLSEGCIRLTLRRLKNRLFITALAGERGSRGMEQHTTKMFLAV